jgi:hypothetical protein
MSRETLIAGIFAILATLGVFAFVLVWAGARHRSLRDRVEYLAGNLETALPLFFAFFVGALVILDRLLVLKIDWLGDLANALTLIVLSGLSFAILRDRQQREELIQEVRLATEGTGGIKIYSSWNEQAVQNLITSATTSIVIIDTWFDEAVPLAYLIDQAKKHAGQLSVDIYMADKAEPYGSQRLREIGEDRIKRIHREYNESLPKSYERLYDIAVTSLQIYVNDKDVDLTIHAHRLMPGIRLIIIDDLKFIFSWFPLGSVSVKNVCFCVEADSVSDRDQKAVEHLRSQRNAIKAHSSVIFSSKLPDALKVIVPEAKTTANSDIVQEESPA